MDLQKTEAWLDNKNGCGWY